MDSLDAWRSSLAQSFRLFAALLAQDRSISIAHGIVAGALLWPVRHDGSSPWLSDTLAAVADTQDVQPLLQLIDLLERTEPLAGAQALSNEARANPRLRSQLDRLLEFFRDDWLHGELLQPLTPSIHIDGSVEGTNVVIGGVQYVAGDLVISQIVQQKIRSCPTAPNPPPHFAGRRSELEQLKNTLSQGRNVAISGVQGMGGIGKTALALKLGAEMRKTQEIGAILWASLGPEPTVLNHLLSWARHADPDFEPGSSPIDLLAGRVQALLTDLVREQCPGRTLVILDDVWEGSSVAAARLLQKAAPLQSVYLVTTRSQLVVAQLRGARLDLKPMSPQESLQMLRNLLPGYPAIPDEVLLDLAEVVGHHPLAMELAAGQVTLLERPDQDIKDLIDQYRGGLPAGSPFRDIHLELGEAREDNLEVVLWFSYASLAEAEQARFRALGVLAYAAPFDRSICRAIWSADPQTDLDALRHRALLSIADTTGWYQQHPLLRAYARALLSQREVDRLQAGERYSDCIVDVTAQLNTLPLGSWSRLDPYVPHVEEVGSLLVAATRAELDRREPDEKWLRRALSFALNTSRLLASRREIHHTDWLEMGLSISQKRMDLGYAAFFLDELGHDSYYRRNMHDAVQKWHAALKTAKAANDKFSLARANTSLGLFYLSSDPMEAPKYLRPAITLYSELDNPTGLVDTLIHLADWHANRMHPYEEREKGLAVLERALSTAQSAGYEQGMAEVQLRLGRLRDTLGERDEAVELLTKAVAEFQRLGERDREGNAHLFLASALANLQRFDEARVHLDAALPLFRRTADSTGLAVALRNLGELNAAQEWREEALASFAEALPLVRKQTMRFLDEDAEEPSFAACFFSAQLEDVIKLELVEQFRARAMESFREKHAEALDEGEREEPASGFVPDDLMHFLLTETIRVKTNMPDAHRSWSGALQDFIRRLSGHGDQYRDEAQLASALIDIIEDREPRIPEKNVYSFYAQALAARLAHRKTSSREVLLDKEEIARCVNNTLAVRIFQPESRSEWSTQLRKQRRGAALWGDEAEREFYAAQLAVLDDRVISLSLSNPYRQAFEDLLGELSRYELLPRELVLERTIAVQTVVPERADDWLDELRRRRLKAVRQGEDNESAFLAALIRWIEGEPADVADDNPYRPLLEQARKAAASGVQWARPLPPAIVAGIMHGVIAAKVTEPKTIDVLAADLSDQRDRAQQLGRLEDVVFFDALLTLLFDERPTLPAASPYQPVLRQILEQIRKSGRRPQPAAHVTVPQSQIDQLIRMVVAARTHTSEIQPQASEHLQQYRRLLATRNEDWENERIFVDFLAALLGGRQPQLPPANPYRSFLAEAREQIDRYGNIQAKGGKIPPDQLDSLLRQTGAQVRAPMDFLKEQFEESGSIADIFSERLVGAVKEQNRWKEILIEMRQQIAAEESEWRHEEELLDALISMLDSQPASVSVESPYHDALRQLQRDIEYQHGLPDNLQTTALATSAEEHGEHFKNLFSGKAYFLEKLDIILMNTVAAKTIGRGNLQAWAASLEKNHRIIAEQAEKTRAGSVEAELELSQSLQAILRDESPFLPEDHPYYLHLAQVLESIRIFEGRSASSAVLTGDQIERCYAMTAGVMTIGREHFADWKEELEHLRQDLLQQGAGWRDAISFIDALLIALEGRPADLSLENPYRPYLHLTRAQIQGLQ